MEKPGKTPGFFHSVSIVCLTSYGFHGVFSSGHSTSFIFDLTAPEIEIGSGFLLSETKICHLG